MIIKFLIKIPFLKRLIPSLFKKYVLITKNFWKQKKIDEINYILDVRYLIDRNFYLRENYEDELFAFAKNKIIKDELNYFLDVGSCWGIYSLRLSKIKLLKIIAFDPILKNINRLRNMIKINNIKNIKVFHTALGNKLGKIKFYGLEEFTPNYSIYDKKNKFQYLAKINRLDNLLKIKNQIIYIKIDVEGHEYFSLIGAKQLIKNNRVNIQCEIINNKQKTINFLKRNKFKLLFHLKNSDDYIFSNYK